MRRKVRIEELQEWFEDPEAELQAFMQSGQAIMSLMFPNSKRPVELNQRDVSNILIEMRTRMPWDCEWCLRINPGTEEECLMCGAKRT
jgi:hypothetical protein